MIDNLPSWIEIVMVITCLITIVLFYYSNGKPKLLTGFIILWSIFHSILAYNEFYRVTDTIPPRFALILFPSSLLIIYGILKPQREWMLANRNTELSTFLHTVRIPVEIVLLNLFFHEMIPELMTFEGRNFDILAGITAPLIGVLFMKKRISKVTLFWWNLLGLYLIIFILVNGILSAELPIQQFAFDQPNIGITYFPFVLIASTIVPIVIYTHLTDLIKLGIELKKQ